MALLIFKPKMKIMPQNFQDNNLEVYKVPQESHRQPIVYTPVCTPVCTNVCTYDFSNAYISGKNEDNATKPSGYYPVGLQGTSRMSWMTHCVYPCLYPCLYYFFQKYYISAKNEDNAMKLSGYDPANYIPLSSI